MFMTCWWYTNIKNKKVKNHYCIQFSSPSNIALVVSMFTGTYPGFIRGETDIVLKLIASSLHSEPKKMYPYANVHIKIIS